MNPTADFEILILRVTYICVHLFSLLKNKITNDFHVTNSYFSSLLQSKGRNSERKKSFGGHRIIKDNIKISQEEGFSWLDRG
jgi:hypothetical protein